jgi:hypothetical protein
MGPPKTPSPAPITVVEVTCFPLSLLSQAASNAASTVTETHATHLHFRQRPGPTAPRFILFLRHFSTLRTIPQKVRTEYQVNCWKKLSNAGTSRGL